ncbi:hypothetical protein WMY93_014685 [Mugilogobius chulae]|uniref:Uncharacterized protein n=1 Tax=Mugilogobius chulae TaxID=88201 RepID=A0AAW0P533_9GOBI
MAAKNTFFELEEVDVDGLVSTPAMFEEEERDFSILNEETTPLPTRPKHVSKFAQNGRETQGDNEDLNLLVDNHRKIIQVLGDDMDKSETGIFAMEEVIKSLKECFDAEIQRLEQDKKLQKEKYEMEMAWLRENLDEFRKKNIQLRLKMRQRQDTETRNQSEMSDVGTFQKTIQDLEEQLRLKTAETDLLRSTNKEFNAANALLKSEAETYKKTIQDLEDKHRIETEERDANMDFLKSTKELAAAKDYLQNKIDSLSKTLETQNDIQDQNKTLRIQKKRLKKRF